jgi:hypothetical protein
MATISELALALSGVCTSVPPSGDGVCRICHGCPNPGWHTCWSCDSVTSQISRPCELVVPISLYEIPSQLHHVLRHYKSNRFPELHDRFGAQVASLLSYFLSTNGECVEGFAGGPWDVITTVPSSGDRGGQHPLVTAMNRVVSLREQSETLLTRGDVAIDHRTASDDGYRTIRPLDGERILLVDDTYTSGSRAQSAASRLSLDGGEVVAIVPLGRVINPSFNETVAEYWRRQRRIPFTFDLCCLESEDDDQDPW